MDDKEAVRLLKLAIDGFRAMRTKIDVCTGICDDCPLDCGLFSCNEWIYENEALDFIRKVESK